MELIGNLKKKVDKASSKEEKRELIEKAGMKLNDMELEIISGGISGGISFQSPPPSVVEHRLSELRPD